ncbi:ABC transporter permease [Mucilaginibacter flavidus]|uniref:ABC transporter permease n=1 Tax=Mucilaginibacter flavidus TaxID=2949309 RepID=UPI00209238DC|nr:ABC transporter permease [Mucilaginibacter flavidus]MCO5949870.1 ABC transporter permease [Mucilaginibacter flavidus]
MRSYFFHISLYDLASVGTLFAGLTLALLLGFAKRAGQTANLFLSLALVVIALKTGGLTPFFLPALGPLLYFYVRQLTCHDRQFRPKDMLHFSLLFIGYWMPAWLVMISVIIYLYLSYRLIENFYNRLRPVLMDRPRFAFRRLERALVLLGMLCVLSLFSDTFSLAVAFVLIEMAAEAILKLDTGAQLAMPITNRSDAREKSRRLKEAVAANRLYEDAELTLTTLAVKLQIHPHDLSRIINAGLEKNFSDFINEFRVREIARKMQEPGYDQLTLLGIAYESGFNSKTTFNRVFKEMTGKTPVEYKNSFKKEVPIDKLAPRLPIRPVILRSESPLNRGPETLKRNIMIRNYLKIAYRQLLRQNMYAAIKIGGFALGIAACLLIGLYIRDETNFDRTYPDADRIYRIAGDGNWDRGFDWPAPMAKAIKNDFPEVEYSGRINAAGNLELRRADQAQNTFEQGFVYADQSFLDALQLPMVFGSGKTALKEPLTLVITKTMADKYYHGQNPVGQVMYLDNDNAHPHRISAVMADIPTTSHLHQFNFFLTLAGMEFGSGEQNNWGWYNYRIYVKLKAGVNAAAFEKKLTADLVKNYLLPESLREGRKDAEKEVKGISLHLQPVTDVNLYSYDLPDGFPHGDIRFIWLFGAIALFILVIACINFINLSTAKSANRAKEVGLRKVVGSSRGSLINQFLTESMVYSLISFVLGLFIAWLVLPYFNTLASKSLIMPWGEWWLVPCVLVSAVIVGTFAGIYPAIYLSSFRPAQVLKGSIANGSKSPLLRNGLVVFQFATSIILIISTIVIYTQTHFILNRKPGFDKDQVMVLQGTNTLGDANIKTFKNELSKMASIKSVSISDYLPIENSKRNQNAFFNEGREKLDASVGGQIWQVDDTYLKTLGIKMVEGRNFSYDRADDTAGKTVVINQLMAKQLNLVNPVGKRISNGNTFTVIGVVQDFNFNSMRGDIDPLVFHFGISPSMMTVKFSGANVQNTVAGVSAVWKKLSPNQPIRYDFLDEQFAGMYADVLRTGNIFTTFAVLAIIIACLGLFALSAFMAEQRSKEIGIRKVLGASVQGITTLLSVDFVKLVLLAILIASPIAWWGMQKWLQDFASAYRISISWWMFAAAGLGAILIALVTVSFQSVRAALANPVKSLRSE